MRYLFALFGLVLIASPSQVFATWSILFHDTESGETGVASATCVTGIDLKAFSPVIRVATGAGAAQSAVDSSGQRRNIIRDGLINGDDADSIVADLVQVNGSAFHQHGVVGSGPSSATQSGIDTFDHSSGVSGSVGNVYYAIQGNILTGVAVIDEAEQALLNTNDSWPGRLMAAMQAARLQGGDGRCSCPGLITGCGTPPPMFDKSADVGFFIVSREGDSDDDNCNANGCADGDYFLDFNIAFQNSGDPDPVLQLQALFDQSRTDRIGLADALMSEVSFTEVSGGYQMEIQLKDWQGVNLTGTSAMITVTHLPDSDQFTAIGAVAPQGNGLYWVNLTLVGQNSGTDHFSIVINDGGRDLMIPSTRTFLMDANSIFSDGFED